MARGRKTGIVVVLTPEERQVLEANLRSRNIGAGLARRVRIILMLADGITISEIGRVVGIRRRLIIYGPSVSTRKGWDRPFKTGLRGQRVTRVVDNLTIARETEASIKGELVRAEYDVAAHKVQEKPFILGELWEKHYKPWAGEHKKSFDTDLVYYAKHIEPRFAGKALADIHPLDLERMKSELRKG